MRTFGIKKKQKMYARYVLSMLSYHSWDDTRGVGIVFKSTEVDGSDTVVVLVKLEKHDNNEDNELGLLLRSDKVSNGSSGRE